MTKKIIALVLVLAAAATAYYFFRNGKQDPNRIHLSGNLELNEISLSFKASGQVTQILVREGDSVKAGQLIAKLDKRAAGFQRERDSAAVTSAESSLRQLHTGIAFQRETIEHEAAIRRAEIQQAEAQLRELEQGSRPQEVQQAQAALDDAKSQLAQAAADWQRSQTLFKAEDISRAQYDQSESRFRSATAAVHNAEQRLSLVKEGPRKESIDLAKAQLARAKAALQLTEASRLEVTRKEQELATRQADIDRAKAQVAITDTQIDDTELRSPVNGVILSKTIDTGETVATGIPIVTVGEIDSPWLRGYITEQQLGRVKLGQKVKLTTDSYPNKVYNGTVTFISSEAEFTPKQIQTPEERVKLVYRIKVEVANPDQELKLSMPVDGEIDLGG